MTENNVVQLLEHMGRCYRRSYVPMKQSRVELIRALLVQELNAVEAPVTIPAIPRFVFSLPSFVQLFHIQALRPVLAVIVLAVFGTGSLLHVASASLPGDALYTIKLVRERAQVQLTRDDKERAKLSVRIALTRADEVRQVVQSNETREQKVERLSVAVAGLEERVSEVSETLAALKDKKEFTSVVREGTEQMMTMLTDAKTEAAKTNGVVAHEVAKALATVSETNNLVELASNPPTTIALSLQVASPVSTPSITQSARVESDEKIERPRTHQPATMVNSAQSVFSLPIAQSVVTGVGELPFATSIQSSP